MQLIKRATVDKYAFDNRDEVVLKVAQGEAFQLETDDALTGLIADDSDDPKVHTLTGGHLARLTRQWPPLYNPVVGPISVEGCENGDVLAVTIDWVDPWRYGFNRTFRSSSTCRVRADTRATVKGNIPTS